MLDHNQCRITGLLLAISVVLTACAARPSSPVDLKVTHRLGGEITQVCLTQESVLFRSAFSATRLHYQDARLHQSSIDHLPQFLSSLNPTHSSHHQSFSKLDPIIQECPSEAAWLSIPTSGELSTMWRGRRLTMTRSSWRWGGEFREQPTKIKDIVPYPNTSPTSYLLVSKEKIWRWRSGYARALLEQLPQQITPPLQRFVREGKVGWLVRGETSMTAWPVSLTSQPMRLIGPQREAPSISPEMLVPISGSALKTRRDSLNFTWRGQHYPSPPIKALCVLRPNAVAIATMKGIELLSGPQGSLAPYRSKDSTNSIRLNRVAHLPLPSPPTALHCEADRMIILGDQFGLLYVSMTDKK